MGVPGLLSFMKRDCPGAVESCNIAQKAKKYREETGIKPLLIIDGSNLITFLAVKATRGNPLGSCQIKGTAVYFLKFLDRVKDAGMDYVMFFGEPKWFKTGQLQQPAEKSTEWREQPKNEFVAQMFEELLAGRKPEVNADSNIIRMLLGIRHIKFYLLNLRLALGIPFSQTIRGAEREIMDYVKNNGSCFGIISSNTDFIIRKEFLHVFSAEDTNPETLDTTMLRRDLLARRLDLLPWQLPFFATVSGNNIISRTDLRNFHNSLIQGQRNLNWLKEKEYLPGVVIFPVIAQWLRPILDENHTRYDLPEYLAERAGLTFLSAEFRESILSYKPTYKPPEENSELEHEWAVILKKTDERVNSGMMLNSIYGILTAAKFHDGRGFQMYNNPDYPADCVLLESFLKRLFGFLLKDRPVEYGEPIVTVRRSDLAEEFSLVHADVPSTHPGLLRLWRDNCPVEDKWNMLCWIVCPDLKPEDVLQIPKELRVPAMAIFYLSSACRKLGSRIEEFQVEALIVTAVKMLTATEEELSSDCEWIDPIAIHWRNVYLGIAHHIFVASGSCGHPSAPFQHPQYCHFDSTIYHVYHAFESGEKQPRQLCAQNNITLSAYDKVKDFLGKYRNIQV